MATETDAARDRVLAARVAFGEELETLEASARTAIDVPAKIKRSPAKAAAVAGGAAFLVLGGPRRAVRAGRRAVFGAPSPLPESMLPRRSRRPCASWAMTATRCAARSNATSPPTRRRRSRDRSRTRTLLLLTVAPAAAVAAAKAAGGWLFRTDDEGFQARLAQIRARTQGAAKPATDEPAAPGVDGPAAGGAGP